MRTLRDLFIGGEIRRFPFLQRRWALADAYQRFFASPDGQLIFKDLMRQGNVLTVTHEPGDPYTSAFNEGRRSLALHILQMVRWSAGELAQLGQEATLDTVAALAQQEGKLAA